MMFTLIISTSILQLLVHYFLRQMKTFAWHWGIGVAFLLLYFFVFPDFLIGFYDFGDLECGMPILGLILGLYIFGACATIVSTLLGYFIWLKVQNKNI